MRGSQHFVDAAETLAPRPIVEMAPIALQVDSDQFRTGPRTGGPTSAKVPIGHTEPKDRCRMTKIILSIVVAVLVVTTAVLAGAPSVIPPVHACTTANC